MTQKNKTNTKCPIESYEHWGKPRINNPLVELVTPRTDPDAVAKTAYSHDPHLLWGGKAEHTSLEMPAIFGEA